MALKPNTKSSLSRRSEKTDKEKITTVISTKNTVTGVSPTTLRIKPLYKAKAQVWCDEMGELAGRKVSLAKILQGLIEMKDSIDKEELLDAIRKTNF